MNNARMMEEHNKMLAIALLMPEEWREIVEEEDWPGYEISSHGRARSLDRTLQHMRRPPRSHPDTPKSLVVRNYRGRILQFLHNPYTGYDSVRLSNNGYWKDRYVHRLVYQAFIGPIPDKKEIDHINFNKRCNHYKNLQTLTGIENRWRSAKLNQEKLEIVVALHEEGCSNKDIAKAVGVTKTTIWHWLDGSWPLAAHLYQLIGIEPPRKGMTKKYAKYTDEQVRKVLRLDVLGLKRREIAEQTGVTMQVVKSWTRYPKTRGDKMRIRMENES